jgi:hypothetical protein
VAGAEVQQAESVGAGAARYAQPVGAGSTRLIAGWPGLFSKESE